MLKSNPKVWSIDEKMNSKNSLISWSVNRYLDLYDLGDIAFVYRIGKEPGIVTSINITTSNIKAYGFDHDQKFQNESYPDLELSNRIIGHIDFDSSFLSLDNMKANPKLSNWAEEISTVSNFTNFQIPKIIGKEIFSLICSRSEALV